MGRCLLVFLGLFLDLGQFHRPSLLRHRVHHVLIVLDPEELLKGDKHAKCHHKERCDAQEQSESFLSQKLKEAAFSLPLRVVPVSKSLPVFVAAVKPLLLLVQIVLGLRAKGFMFSSRCLLFMGSCSGNIASGQVQVFSCCSLGRRTNFMGLLLSHMRLGFGGFWNWMGYLFLLLNLGRFVRLRILSC
jgi:hypothetical protein